MSDPFYYDNNLLAEPVDTIREIGNTQGESLNTPDNPDIAADRLKDHSERLRAALTASQTGTFRWNIQTNELNWDDNLDRLFGLPPGQTVQSLDSFIACVHRDDRVGVIERCRRCAADGADFDMEFRVVWPDGSEHWLYDKGKTFFDDEGRPLYMTGACVDITARKRTTEALHRSEQRFAAAVKAVQGILWTNTAEGQMQGLQPGWAELTGQCYEEYQGYGWADAVHPDDVKSSIEAWQEAVRERKTFVFEHRVKMSDGRWGQFSIRAIPLMNNDGTVREWVGVHTDITEQRKAEQALRESEHQLRQVSDFMPQIVWSTDADGYHHFYNKRWYEFTGLSYDRSKGEGWANVLHPDDRQRTETLWQQSLDTGRRYETEYRMRRADGKYRWLLARAIPLRNGDGSIVQWFGTCTDIHGQKSFSENLESLVRERTEELQRSNEDLMQFAHVTSHDLKEPVRKIRVFAGMLDQQFGHSLPEGGKIFLEKVLRGTERISDIIEGVLAYSSLDSEHRDHTVVNLAEVLQQVQADLELQIQNKGARISCTNLPTIVASPVSMHQLFYNLLNNALKFTRNGIAPLISIHGAVLGQDAARRALVSVQDNGIGFEQHYADRIFTTFTRLHSKDAYEGSGLGLALCKKIVERHGGTIRAESTPGEGAAFILELPLG